MKMIQGPDGEMQKQTVNDLTEAELRALDEAGMLHTDILHTGHKVHMPTRLAYDVMVAFPDPDPSTP